MYNEVFVATITCVSIVEKRAPKGIIEKALLESEIRPF